MALILWRAFSRTSVALSLSAVQNSEHLSSKIIISLLGSTNLPNLWKGSILSSTGAYSFVASSRNSWLTGRCLGLDDAYFRSRFESYNQKILYWLFDDLPGQLGPLSLPLKIILCGC
jgi:hypothetical protein